MKLRVELKNESLIETGRCRSMGYVPMLLQQKRKTRVEIILKNSEVLTGYVDVPKGTPDNAYSIDEISGKLISALNFKGKKAIVRELLHHIEQLEKNEI
ncbi:hypothetical protein DYI25_14650 [Mesobacillus boroniphilus]|uniref:Uncharacterized protein n=1 Tax=Mesobacillus boroniphilus TaxID=308892 RepID=A0A944CM51_9BACI|nr:hypothetical protein [Mesobacillus boroniphilus]MBS8265663.1 hypothetical protein [Mesobacillus boroniphilus]